MNGQVALQVIGLGDSLSELAQYATAGNARRIRFDFPNGHVASLVNDGYGSVRGLYEIGMFDLTAADLVTIPELEGDVAGYLSAEQALEMLTRAFNLPPLVPEVSA
jgi:hypothetical protein